MYDEVIDVAADDVRPAGWVRTVLGDGQVQYLLTGVVVPAVRGGDSDWRKVTIRATIPYPDLAAGQRFTATQWAPSVSVAALAVETGDAPAGWAIDEFALTGTNAPHDSVMLEVKAACRHGAAFLLRLSYSIVIVGSYA